MVEHTVKVTIPKTEVGKSDFVFEVQGDRRSRGRLKVSKGALNG
jgi:hypothetical protein